MNNNKMWRFVEKSLKMDYIVDVTYIDKMVEDMTIKIGKCRVKNCKYDKVLVVEPHDWSKDGESIVEYYVKIEYLGIGCQDKLIFDDFVKPENFVEFIKNLLFEY